ncbi:hypothetical protein [Brevibacillus laterosporus]|uniref:hypothetical protein n=1 Tax=Brevibacillus laterosporus TaxID=1465 RepID=UPI003D240AEC
MHRILKKLDRRIHYIVKRDKPWNQYKEISTDVLLSRTSYVERVPLCPVCGADMEYGDDYMEHILLEEWERCPNRCYSYQFNTGSTETCIGNIIVHGYYKDDKKERGHQERIINMALIHERERRKRNESR